MRFNKKYQSYKTKNGKSKHIHARVGEKKYSYEHIPKGYEIHHIDCNKDNNQKFNLILLHKKDHRRVHKGTLIIKSVQPSKNNNENDEDF